VKVMGVSLRSICEGFYEASVFENFTIISREFLCLSLLLTALLGVPVRELCRSLT
jgi:hypothetical protein